jgi:uncharacterized protein YcbK (DUF882 family)
MGILRPKGGRPKAGSVLRGCVAAAVFALGLMLFGAGPANAEVRSLKINYLHTREKAEIVFKRNGRYDQDGLRKLNYILRDWRRNEPTRMDPRLFDLIWEAYRQTGSNEYIAVVCGYRAPETNSMLRSRSKGVAKKSQHMLGKAMDFFIPGVPLKKLREIGLKMQGGGVGYYPTSGSPFVHFDVGNVRHWPRMSRKELIAIFPNGNTLHVPSDGKPLPGFDQAVAAYEARKKSGEVAIASLGTSYSSSSSSSSKRSWLASLFSGGGADDEEDSATIASADEGGGDAQPASAAKAKPAKPDTELVAAATTKPDNKIRILSPDQANRADIPAANDQEQNQETIVAALPDRAVPLPESAPRPKADVGMSGPAGLYGSPDQASAQPAAVPIEEVALNIPLPRQRPAYAPPPELGGKPADQATLVASADASAEAGLPLPEARPEAQTAADQIASTIAAAPAAGPEDPSQGSDEIATTIAALPEARPDDNIASADDEAADDVADSYTVASLPATAPEAIEAAFPTATSKEIIPEAKSALGEELAYATPRAAVVNRKPGTDPIAAVMPTVKTTAKEARATRKDLKKAARQPIVLAAQPAAARWALDGNYAVENAKNTMAPSFAYSLRTPKEVYTDGFQRGVQIADSRRFTGKAVTFMSVAKFTTD